MISMFKPKIHATQGIEVTSPATQALEIASMVKAASFSVDGLAGTAEFSVTTPDYANPGETLESTIQVKIGQVICVTNGAISVMSRDSFYETFEPDQ